METPIENNTYYNEKMKSKFEELIKKDLDFIFHIDNFWEIRGGLFNIMQKSIKKGDRVTYNKLLPMCESLDGIIEVMVETNKGLYHPKFKK